MLVPGQTISLAIEKPAAGGRMIARANGLVVLVAGAIPGERVSARVTRLGKGVAYADTIAVEEPSPDRRAPRADPLCGGCLLAHVAYARQLEIKTLVVADAFARIARAPLHAPVAIAPSPVEGYRMRARLHWRGGRLGFFREGTHDLCDARQTGQLLPATTDVLDRIAGVLAGLPLGAVAEIEIAENVDASDRAVHLDAAPGNAVLPGDLASAIDGLTGVTASGPGGVRVIGGSPYVADTLRIGDETMTLRRHVLAFFQGNRFLLRDFVTHVAAQVPAGGEVVDLYAGGGLFSVAAARVRGARVTAVEGDRVAADDLLANAASVEGIVSARHQSVEAFAHSAKPGADVVIVDPPRTGMSREALEGVVRLGPARLIYVSCDVATLARDTRRLIDAGYGIARADGFDLFPNTPHVETVVVFET